MKRADVLQALGRLRKWVEAEEFRGYDPYDTLTGSIDFRRFGKWAPIGAIQVQKRNPVNLRPALGIEKAYNPKGMGLFLEAYSLIYANEGDESARGTANWLFDWLFDNRSQGYRGACWGYNFDWASPSKYLPAFTPSAVVTGFVIRGVFTYYQATRNPRALQLLIGACDFLMNDLPMTETADGICFSYTPVDLDCCYNASLLGAEVLAMTYSISGDPDLIEWATKAVDFVLAYQKEDGHWNYSLNIRTGAEREQVDFHQGFILDSLYAYLQYADPAHLKVREAIQKGAGFYKKWQFSSEGRSYWRLPAKWPTDIHHQAQGILTFAKLADVDTSHRIADWTIRDMQDEDGYFYYRVGRLLTNRIPYIRWGQAWMMVALAKLLSSSTASVDEVGMLRHVLRRPASG